MCIRYSIVNSLAKGVNMKLLQAALITTVLVSSSAMATEKFDLGKISMCSSKAVLAANTIIKRYNGLSKKDMVDYVNQYNYPLAITVVKLVYSKPDHKEKADQYYEMIQLQNEVFTQCFVNGY